MRVVRDGSVARVFYVIFCGDMHNILMRRTLPRFGAQVDAAFRRAYAE